MDLIDFATMRGLQAAYERSNAHVLDALPDLKKDALALGALKRVQFETLPEHVDLLENACRMLGCSRREFLELAMMDAIQRAEEAFKLACGVGSEGGPSVVLTVQENKPC